MEIIFIALFVLFFICFTVFVITTIKKQVSRIFTEDYSELKQKYPSPLYTWGVLSGSLSTKCNMLPFIFRGLLKIDVYEKMLIISAIGQGLCVPYAKYALKQKKALMSYLVIENLPVYGKRGISPIDFKQTSTLKINLSADKIDTILKLAQK